MAIAPFFFEILWSPKLGLSKGESGWEKSHPGMSRKSSGGNCESEHYKT